MKGKARQERGANIGHRRSERRRFEQATSSQGHSTSAELVVLGSGRFWLRLGFFVGLLSVFLLLVGAFCSGLFSFVENETKGKKKSSDRKLGVINKKWKRK